MIGNFSLADLGGGGRARRAPPPTGPDSFIQTYKISETYLPRESTAPFTRSTPPPPTGNPGSATVFVHGLIILCWIHYLIRVIQYEQLNEEHKLQLKSFNSANIVDSKTNNTYCIKLAYMEESCHTHIYKVRDRFVIYCQNNDLLHRSILSLQWENHEHPLTAIVKFSTTWFQVLKYGNFPRSVQVGFSLPVDPTGTLLGNVSCVTTQN